MSARGEANEVSATLGTRDARIRSPGGATETMTLPRFGKITPLQGDVLELAGYVLSRNLETSVVPESNEERIEIMRRGRAALVRHGPRFRLRPDEVDRLSGVGRGIHPPIRSPHNDALAAGGNGGRRPATTGCGARVSFCRPSGA